MYINWSAIVFSLQKFHFITGEGMEQATQLVALQSEDGTQQLAVPVIDPHTGQVHSFFFQFGFETDKYPLDYNRFSVIMKNSILLLTNFHDY